MRSRFESSQGFNLVDVGAVFLAGPVMKVYRQARGLLPGAPCEVFYSGSVPPPD